MWRSLAGRVLPRLRVGARGAHAGGAACWACGAAAERGAGLFCGRCRALQRPAARHNYFRLLGVPESYDLDAAELAAKYKELQKYLHPDKFSNKDKSEQIISEEYSALVNEAYNTLLEPLARGIYMLRLRGHDLPEETQLDKEFLMDIMEKNEEVENATSVEDIMRLNKENQKVIQELTKQLSTAFFAGNMQTVIRILSHMKYYTSIDNQIQAAIRNKGIIQ